MIEAKDLRKTFGEVVAVDDVSLSAADGRITGVLGPNGAGKTTSMRMISTLVRPDRGRVQVDGFDAATEPAAVRRRLGVLPDARGLYPRLTARENIEYFGRLQGLDAATLRTRVDALIDRLELGEVAARRVHGFSQGERAKVAIARALVHEPQNVLLDEPTNGLDVMSTRAMREVIRGLRDEGKAVVFCSHVMQEVSALCDTIVVVARGTVVAQGTREALLAQAETDSLEDAFVKIIGTEEGLVA